MESVHHLFLFILIDIGLIPALFLQHEIFGKLRPDRSLWKAVFIHSQCIVDVIQAYVRDWTLPASDMEP
jgi:hypothetical protein